MGRFARIAFTPSVLEMQEHMGSRKAYRRALEGPATADALGDDERAFLAEQDHFFLASVSETGWPYVQHRGGPEGFVRVLDAHRLAFADYRGNRQYLSVGNVARDDRVALIFVDYAAQARMKVLAHARPITKDDDPATFARVVDGREPTKVERVMVLEVEGIDWNCPQHIVPRYTEEEVREGARPLLARIEALEEELRALRAR
jgi:predicted pyridoxine 5'-phosphate oxidase superfamily flavin-nucleotide-binding protein